MEYTIINTPDMPTSSRVESVSKDVPKDKSMEVHALNAP